MNKTTMEKIMSKTSAINTAATSKRELTEADLALVSGGTPSAAKSSPAPAPVVISIIAVLIG